MSGERKTHRTVASTESLRIQFGAWLVQAHAPRPRAGGDEEQRPTPVVEAPPPRRRRRRKQA